MVRVALIYPGATDFDDQDRIQGALDVPLNERGQHEVSAAAGEMRRLSLQAVYCGDTEPCLATATSIAEAAGCKLKKMGELRNANLGLWQGLKREEVRRKHPRVYRQWSESPERVCPPGGEMLSQVQERAGKALQGVLKRHRNDSLIGIVVSEPMASVVRSYLQGRELAEVWEADRSNGRWELLEVNGEG